MAHRQLARDKPIMHGDWQIPQAHQIGDMTARFANNPAQFFLAMAIIFNQPPIGLAFFPGVELFALNIFNERNFQRCSVIKFFNNDRDLMKSGTLCGTPTTFPSHNLQLAIQIPHNNGLQHPQIGD